MTICNKLDWLRLSDSTESLMTELCCLGSKLMADLNDSSLPVLSRVSMAFWYTEPRLSNSFWWCVCVCVCKCVCVCVIWIDCRNDTEIYLPV